MLRGDNRGGNEKTLNRAPSHGDPRLLRHAKNVERERFAVMAFTQVRWVSTLAETISFLTNVQSAVLVDEDTEHSVTVCTRLMNPIPAIRPSKCSLKLMQR